MCCDLAESVGSIDCEIKPEKGMNFFSFVLFRESKSIVHNLGTTGPIQVGFSANVPLQMSNTIKSKTENVTC